MFRESLGVPASKFKGVTVTFSRARALPSIFPIHRCRNFNRKYEISRGSLPGRKERVARARTWTFGTRNRRRRSSISSSCVYRAAFRRTVPISLVRANEPSPRDRRHFSSIRSTVETLNPFSTEFQRTSKRFAFEGESLLRHLERQALAKKIKQRHHSMKYIRNHCQ